jgi:DNA-binding NarL/FixJ family response regulator
MSVASKTDVETAAADWSRRDAAINKDSDVTLVLADRSQIMLAGMNQICAHEPGFRVVATSSDDDLTVASVKAHRPDVLVLSLSTGKPEFAVLESLKAIRDTANIPTRTVLVADPLDEDDTVRAMRLGVYAIVVRDMPPVTFVRCIKKIHAGDRWVEHGSIGKIVERLLRREAAASELAVLLTTRETQIMRLVASGMSNRDVANRVHVSEGTVKTHLHHIYEKVSVRGRLELTLKARDKGWV